MASQVTNLLKRWGAGEKQVEAELFACIYEDLRRLARHYIGRERADHTLQATALVHEAYLRILGSEPIGWQDRNHFMALASRAMRRILVDHARAGHAQKRHPAPVAEEPPVPFSDRAAAEVLAVHDALDQLAAAEPRQAQVVELHYFGGHSFEEIADSMGVSTRTIKRDWRRARETLFESINGKAS